jgi:hypothetical protein
MIRHILLVKFKSKSSPKQIQEVLEEFEFIPTRIDGISDVEWGENNSPEKLNDGYSHCIQITFENEKGARIIFPTRSMKR